MKAAPINTRVGKRKFLRDLLGNIAKDLIAQVDRMPSEWDGHELRELIAMDAMYERGALAKIGPRREAFERVVRDRIRAGNLLPAKRRP